MSQGAKPPAYMAQLLDALGWNQGTRIPLADSANIELETLLIDRQTELQRLKEALTLQKQKVADLNNYKSHVLTEYQENTRLLFAHKQQMEQEVKLRQLSVNEADSLDRDIIDTNKQSKDIETRIDRFQKLISNHLKKADSMKAEVCGERGALSEWRAALERYACDITAIEQFTKQDVSKAKAMETKRQKLKLEHDRMHERLVQLVSNLSAEERACDRISVQVIQGMEERKQIMNMWTSAVENLRQRDTDIRHVREDYAVLEKESNKLAEQVREQQAFCEQQRGNNNDAMQENMSLANQLGQIRMSYQRLLDMNASLDSESQSLQRELSNMRGILERLRCENRSIMDEQFRKDTALHAVECKIKEHKEKLAESMDKSKSSEKRAKELEDILNEEERYANQITTNQQRAMHCSFTEQQKLLALQNEEKLFHMQLKASKAVCSKLEYKQKCIQKLAQSQKESLYIICYQVETIGARVAHMEGAQSEREFSAELAEKEERMKEVCARHAARVSLLERHSAKLLDDMRRLAREVETRSAEHVRLQSRLKTAMLNVQGGEKELTSSRQHWRRMRVEEALMRLRVAHAARAVNRLDDTAFSLDEQRLQIEAAMNERLVEINTRRDMFAVQKRALLEDCGKLRSEVREREQRIDQLIKRSARCSRTAASCAPRCASASSASTNLLRGMNERLVEINTRRDMFAVQKRALFEDCGKLRSEVREREQRIDQLIKRGMNERLVEINTRRDMFAVQKRALFEDCGKLRSEVREREQRIDQLIKRGMNERLVEINTRRDMFAVQKRALFEDCGKLRSEVREREQRIDQLIKRYEIFIDSLGKDDSGQQLTVTFFKIKFAAERAELRERGAALDADIGRRERDVSALEATLRVVHAAHQHFIHHISPLSEHSSTVRTLTYCHEDAHIGRRERDVSALEATLRVVHAAHQHFIHHISPLSEHSSTVRTLTYCHEDAHIGRRERDVSALEATLRVVHAAHQHFIHHISPLSEHSSTVRTLTYCHEDAHIGRRERDVSALEATLRVVHAAHQHFIHHISPLSEHSSEIEELNALRDQYYELRSELQALQAKISRLEEYNRDADARLTLLADKNKQLDARRYQCLFMYYLRAVTSVVDEHNAPGGVQPRRRRAPHAPRRQEQAARRQEVPVFVYVLLESCHKRCR
ncbi:hypothetical protein PYW07_014456 [Mythimna separata]|uniref:Coiled-coil domain-containing protein 39 n=1 Tax=Mythimna separata TaxID=271217 RepID=A0AAD7YZT4_MYTSE|nr:hypothetical protein PYW07_014456 [Mythimna separata]